MTEKRNHFYRAGLVVALLTILSKCIGFFREALIAAYFGTTAETDAFFLANSMPGTLFPAVCTSISTAFVSLYIDRITRLGKEEGDRYASRMLWAALLFSVFLSVIGVLVAPVMVSVFAPGFSAPQKALASHLSRITMGAFSLTMLNYMVSAILNANQIFVRSQIALLFYNVSIIILTAFGGPGQSVAFLTWAFILSSGIQTLALVMACRKNFHMTLAASPIHSDTRQLMRQALPILLGNSVVQINTIVDKILTSYLPDGSLSALNYGHILTMIVTGVLITSLSTVLYPTLTSCISRGDTREFTAILSKSIRLLSWILIPISIITVFSAEDIVTIVYGRGKFDRQAIQATALTLSCYAPIFLAYGVREIVTKAFYAFQDSKTPMVNSSVGVVCNVVLSIALAPWLGIAGIALGTTLSAYISGVLLSIRICKKAPGLSFGSLYQPLVSGSVGGIFLIAVMVLFPPTLFPDSSLLRFGWNTLLGFGVYASTVFVSVKCLKLSHLH